MAVARERARGAEDARGGSRTLALALALALAGLAAEGSARAETVSWATAQAAELTRQGREQAAKNEPDIAAGRFLEAIKFDATYGPAYIGLGALHEQSGDAREAERAYTMGIERVPGFADGHRARARLRLRQGRHADAIADAEAAADLEPEAIDVLRELAQAYIAAGALPAALAVVRRAAAIADAQGDARAFSDASLSARALGVLVGEADPVLAGRAGRGAVRRALALRALGKGSSTAR
jgi:tetratricopeptide (TPR) repeat protein